MGKQNREKCSSKFVMVTAESAHGSSGSGSSQPQRATWGGQLEFLLTLIGCAVGLGNVWRYPYLCYKNGGGAFIIPFIICLVIIGLPMVFMELSVGQFSSLGPITMWKLNPSMKGLGYGMVMVSLVIGLYYNVIIAYCLYYLFVSLRAEVPWQSCNNPWNTPACVSIDQFASNWSDGMMKRLATVVTNATASFADSNSSVVMENAVSQLKKASPSEEFFYREVLKITGGMGEPGGLRWELIGCLALSWMLVALVLCMGIKSIGKVVWFTTLFPYALLTVLVIRTAMLEGSFEGVKYYLTPQWDKLTDFTVWSDAATQIFYSLGLCTGCLIAMASYNKFDHNILRDALAVPIINVITCIYAGFITFSVLGYMAHAKNTTIESVADGGPGLAFIVYPEALATMPLPPLWSVFFFFMMCILGFSSQISLVEGVLTAFLDEFPILKKTRRRELVYRVSFCAVGFLLGVPMLTEGGMYLLNLVDASIGTFPLLFIGIIEVVVIIYVYGYETFAYDTQLMLGKRPSIYFMVTLRIICPIALIVTIVLTIYQHKPLTFRDYVYEDWANAVGWLIVTFTLGFIPFFSLLEYRRHGGLKVLQASNKPNMEWGPALAIHRVGTDYDLQKRLVACGGDVMKTGLLGVTVLGVGDGLDGIDGKTGVDNSAYGSSGFGSSGSHLIVTAFEDTSAM